MESRVAAVTSLAQTAHTLFDGAADPGKAGPRSQEREGFPLVLRCVVDPLLDALRDYTTDNRFRFMMPALDSISGIPACECVPMQIAMGSPWRGISLNGPKVLDLGAGLNLICKQCRTNQSCYRGDIGSWVREAAMAYLPGALLLLRRLCRFGGF